MKHLSTLCALVAMIPLASAPAQEWTKVYGESGEEYAYGILPTADGGFVTGGLKSLNFDPTSVDFWIARFDADGEKLWDSTYGKKGVQETIFAFNNTLDGGFMIGGFTGVQFGGQESAEMFNVDGNGQTRWTVDINYADSDHWHLLIDRMNGGYYFGGHTDSKGDTRGDVWLVRTDDDRNIIWEKTYDRNTGEHAHAGVETKDGGCLLLGHTSVGFLEKWWVIRVDSNGMQKWNKVYSSGDVDHDSPYRVFETNDGNFMLIGGSSDGGGHGGGESHGSTMWMLVIDSLGNIVIDKHYGKEGWQSFAWGGRPTSDGGYILSGYTMPPGGTDQMYVVKTDAEGNVEWEKTFGSSGTEIAFDVIEVADGYIAAGYTDSPSLLVGGAADLMLVKIKKETPQAWAPARGADWKGFAHRVSTNPVAVGGRTSIRLDLSAPASARVIIYNSLGQPVRTLMSGERIEGGAHRLAWNLTDDGGTVVPAGAYFYRVDLDGAVDGGTIVVR